MNDRQLWEHPTQPLDEDTATREKLHAEERVATAATAQIQAEEVASTMRSLVDVIREMHKDNHYVERLLPVLRGTHRHAS